MTKTTKPSAADRCACSKRETDDAIFALSKRIEKLEQILVAAQTRTAETDERIVSLARASFVHPQAYTSEASPVTITHPKPGPDPLRDVTAQEWRDAYNTFPPHSMNVDIVNLILAKRRAER